MDKKSAVGVDEERERLKKYLIWTPEEQEEFDQYLAAQRTIDNELWRGSAL